MQNAAVPPASVRPDPVFFINYAYAAPEAPLQLQGDRQADDTRTDNQKIVSQRGLPFA
jgi:hypothetical protein